MCSDLLRFAPICSDSFSEQIRETPFCRPLLQVPDLDDKQAVRAINVSTKELGRNLETLKNEHLGPDIHDAKARMSMIQA